MTKPRDDEICWWPQPGRVGICGKWAVEIIETVGDDGRRAMLPVCKLHVAQARKDWGNR